MKREWKDWGFIPASPRALSSLKNSDYIKRPFFRESVDGNRSRGARTDDRDSLGGQHLEVFLPVVLSDQPASTGSCTLGMHTTPYMYPDHPVVENEIRKRRKSIVPSRGERGRRR